MNNKEESVVSEETLNKKLIEEIEEMNRQWYQKPWLVILSLILGLTTFLGGFFVEFDVIWQSALQTVFFIFSAGFFVIVLSFLFNKTWQYSIKKKSANEYMLMLLLQVVSIAAIFVNIILMSITYRTSIAIADVKAVYVFTYLKNDYDILMPNGRSLASLDASDRKFWYMYKLGVEYSQTFIILIVIYAIVIVILGITSYYTYKKIRSPFILKKHLIYLFNPLLFFYYGFLVSFHYAQKNIAKKPFKISKSPAYLNFKRTAIYMLVPLLLVGLFFALYALTNYSMGFLFELDWPYYF